MVPPVTTAQKGASHFGQKLREARERRGLTLRQIADATKISMITLEALERNDVARLPGGLFSRAFVRSCTRSKSASIRNRRSEEFVAQIPIEPVTTGRPTPKHVEDHEAVESDQRMASTFLRLILISVPVAAIVVYLAMFGRRTTSPEAAAPAAQSVAQAAAASEIVHPAIVEPDPAQTAAADAAPVDRLVVLVKATQRCWVSAVVDGQKTVQRTFLPGDEQTLDAARDVILTTGDPSALTVTINGATARPLGPGGQQATARLTLANFKDYLPTP